MFQFRLDHIHLGIIRDFCPDRGWRRSPSLVAVVDGHHRRRQRTFAGTARRRRRRRWRGCRSTHRVTCGASLDVLEGGRLSMRLTVNSGLFPTPIWLQHQMKLLASCRRFFLPWGRVMERFESSPTCCGRLNLSVVAAFFLCQIRRY